MISKRTALAALSLMTLTGALAQQNKPDVLTSVTVGGWDPGFDPAYCWSAGCAWILNNTMETLFRKKDKDPSVMEPLLAAQMPSTANGGISKDGRTYTIKLKKGLKFSDGTPLTADDVAYSFKRMLVYAAPSGPSSLLTSPLLGSEDVITAKTPWADIDGTVKATAPDTVVFTIKRPFAPFVSILSFPSFGIVSKAAAVKAGDWSGTQKDWQNFVGMDVAKSKFAGTGLITSAPFLVERYDAGKLVVLKRNDRYWRAPAKFSRVIVQSVDDDNTRMQLLKTGDVDMAERNAIPAPLLPQLQGSPNIVVDTDPPLGMSYGMFFTYKLTPSELTGSGKLDGQGIPANFFADKNVRTGFAYAFDTDGYIKEVLQGRAVVASTLNVQGLLGYSKTNPQYKLDKDKATAAFKKAFGGELWNKGFTFTTQVVAGRSDNIRMLDIMKRGLESINPKFRMNIQEVQSAQLRTSFLDHKVPLYTGAWGVDYIDPHNMFQPLVGSDGYYAARTLYKNPKVDALIQQGLVETNPLRRAGLYQQLGRMVFDDVALLPVYSPTRVRVQQKWITGRAEGDEYYYSIVKK